jgi:hypothetical protein
VIAGLAGAPGSARAQSDDDEAERAGEGRAPAASEEDAGGEGGSSSLGSSALLPGDLDEEEAAQGGSGAGAAAGEDDEAAAEAAQAQREPFPWRNSFLSWTHGVTPNTFIRNAQLSYNPYYYWLVNFNPRWYLDPATFFFLSQSIFWELTNDDGSSAYNRDVQITDTIVELRRNLAWEGFVFIPGVRVVLPASKASQAAQRYFGAALGLIAVRPVPEAAGLTIALVGRYQYWFAGSNVPRLMGGVPGQTFFPTPFTHQRERLEAGGGAATYADAPTIDQAALTSGRHMVVAGLTVNITPLQNFTVSVSAFYVGMEGHGLAPACFHALTSPTAECIGDNGPTHWRHSTSLSLTLAYDVMNWLNLALGWSNSSFLAPLFNDDGSVRSPFNPDNNFTLAATVQIDALYESVFAGGEDDGLTPEQRQRRRQGLAHRGSGTGGSM